ncbi:MFS transporter [Neoactinobaculum massilliense]|uniref:MFS transporter n=1 Tax=Neoactinobaculum massilliense TaxID=2364794 RepID=UPI001F1536D7|nr:MFS transporter [Neoactinobaculum massilliense]
MSARHILRNTVFRRLTVTTFTNELSQAMAYVVIPLLVLAQGGSATAAGGVVFIYTATGILSQLLSGAIVDRRDASGILRISSLMQALSWTVIAVALIGDSLSIGLLATLLAISSACASLSAPSEHALVQRVVPVTEYGAANSVMQGREATANLLGGPIGGALFGINMALTLIIQASLHFIATAVCPRVATSGKEATRQSTSFFTSVLAGFRLVWRNRGLRSIVGIAALINLPLAMQPLAMIAYYESTGRSPLEIGIYSASMGVGVLLGAPIAGRIADRWSIARLGISSLATLAVAFTGISLTYSSLPLSSLISCIGGLGLPAFNAALGGYTMAVTPDDRIGSVVAASGVPGMILMPLGALLGGILFDVIGVWATLTLVAILAAIPAALTIVLPSFRRLSTLSNESSKDTGHTT